MLSLARSPEAQAAEVERLELLATRARLADHKVVVLLSDAYAPSRRGRNISSEALAAIVADEVRPRLGVACEALCICVGGRFKRGLTNFRLYSRQPWPAFNAV